MRFDIIGLQRDEIRLIDLVGPSASNRVGDELHAALEELRCPFDVDIVAVVEVPVVALVGVPHPRRDRAAAVR